MIHLQSFRVANKYTFSFLIIHFATQDEYKYIILLHTFILNINESNGRNLFLMHVQHVSFTRVIHKIII